VCIFIAMKSTDIVKALLRDGWSLKRVTGSHHHFHHPRKPGIVTVPHPRKDIPLGTLRSIEKQSGLKLR
jgi:predicted RNA binding protein YcfA (HicA-like mRNA interferase family)